ncbi:MAG: ABC transporter permease, partial [Microvirga sp.]
MSVLRRKLLRDVWRFRSQVLTIALLVATGVTVLVGSVSTYVSLLTTQADYYRDSRLAEVWADVKRAPQSLLASLSQISGAATIEARIVKDVRVEWPRSDLSVTGRIVSIPAGRQPQLNLLHLERGRWPDPLKGNEILVNAGFAEAWSIVPGDPIDVVLNGRIQTFRVAGIARSPEFVYASRPGNPLPDDRTFIVLWADEDSVAAAFDMQGAFNNLTLSLAPGASAQSVIAALDRRLESYGAPGGYERRDQPSHRFLSDELAEQRTLAIAVPIVFFAVAAFLLNVVLGRLVESQREQIAALKALGFPSFPIGSHYLQFVAVICALGSLAGIGLGIWYGHGMINNYRPFFRFPEMTYTFPVWLPAAAVSASFIAAAAGALTAVRRVLLLKPAEAMRPPVPASYGHALAGTRLSPVAKLIMRGILGRPIRTCLTIIGIALAVPMVVLGLFWWDALRYMVEVQFDGIDRGDAFVAFTDPISRRAIREIGRIPGVLAVEGQRIVPVRMRAGNRTYRIGLTGLAEGSELRVPRDRDMRPLSLSGDGLMISNGLAERLGLQLGSSVTVEVLEGKRPTRELPI